MSFTQFTQSRDGTPVYVLISAIQSIAVSKEFGEDFSTVTCLDNLVIEVTGRPEDLSSQVDKNRQ